MPEDLPTTVSGIPLWQSLRRIGQRRRSSAKQRAVPGPLERRSFLSSPAWSQLASEQPLSQRIAWKTPPMPSAETEASEVPAPNHKSRFSSSPLVKNLCVAKYRQALLTILMAAIFIYLGQNPQFPGSGTYLRVTLFIPVSGEFIASELEGKRTCDPPILVCDPTSWKNFTRSIQEVYVAERKP